MEGQEVTSQIKHKNGNARAREKEKIRYMETLLLHGCREKNSLLGHIRRDAMWAQDKWKKHHKSEETPRRPPQRNPGKLTKSLVVLVFNVTVNRLKNEC